MKVSKCCQCGFSEIWISKDENKPAKFSHYECGNCKQNCELIDQKSICFNGSGCKEDINGLCYECKRDMLEEAKAEIKYGRDPFHFGTVIAKKPDINEARKIASKYDVYKEEDWEKEFDENFPSHNSFYRDDEDIVNGTHVFEFKNLHINPNKIKYFIKKLLSSQREKLELGFTQSMVEYRKNVREELIEELKEEIKEYIETDVRMSGSGDAEEQTVEFARVYGNNEAINSVLFMLEDKLEGKF